MERELNTELDEQYKRQFTDPIHKIGRITILIAAILSMMPGIYVGIHYDAFPPIQSILSGWASVFSAYFAIYIIEPISYFPILGTAGTYMSFLSGNIGNMRVPCAMIAQEVVGAEQNTKKGELVATLGIAGSIVTNIIALTIIAFVGGYVLELLPVVVQEALRLYTTPVLFGAMLMMFGGKSVRTIVVALCIALFFTRIVVVNAAWLKMLLCVVGTVAFNLGVYRLDKKSKE